ncbi:MAG: glutamate racemase [Clostridia bacterium]|nr:glutamate racemase [Clostridia bacterium]
MDNRPIGIFDSGCGGLTVLKEYLNLLPNENYIYFGDTARLPYGSKSKQTIIEFSKQIVNFLISKDVKMIIIACGTASACAYDVLKDLYDIPIRSIITPTAKAVDDKEIGVIATKGTINSNAWEESILAFHNDSLVISKACPLFVPLVEEGFANTEVAKLVAKDYLNVFENSNISSLILGCTHYPILEKTIKETIANNINIVNIGYYSALDTKEYLESNSMLNLNRALKTVEFYSSDDSKTFIEYSKCFGNLSTNTVCKIDISKY